MKATLSPAPSPSAASFQPTLPTSESSGSSGPAPALSRYDALVLKADPEAYWTMDGAGPLERDATGHGHDAAVVDAQRTTVVAPNGDRVLVFDGVGDYAGVASSPQFSIPTTGSMTWEGWILPSTLQFPHGSATGYVAWMGKCYRHAPTCEWQARMYSADTAQGRCSRLSGYVFNPEAGLGSGADWQPDCTMPLTGRWLHVVTEYTVHSTPPECPSGPPGQINIWVNGILWNAAAHRPTGCFSQYQVIPVANDSPLTIGTMDGTTWFAGAIGKVALYDRLLTQAEISSHYKAMTSRDPAGSCATTCTSS